MLGGIIGGVIGHQIGSGRGQDTATVAGAADRCRRWLRQCRARATAREMREEVVQRCDIRYEQDYEERIEGYRVTYEYNGREYTTRMPYDPGERRCGCRVPAE